MYVYYLHARIRSAYPYNYPSYRTITTMKNCGVLVYDCFITCSGDSYSYYDYITDLGHRIILLLNKPKPKPTREKAQAPTKR